MCQLAQALQLGVAAGVQEPVGRGVGCWVGRGCLDGRLRAWRMLVLA